MREILFRGKRIDNGEWIEGYYFKHDSVKVCLSADDPKTKHLIAFDGFCDWGLEPPLQAVEVISKTIGQYTGLEDKNGKKIFEGDVLHYLYEPGKGFWNADQLSVIDFRGTGFHMNGIMGTNKYACMHGWLVSIPYDQDAENKPEFEVVGNIHDNPELLKEADHA